MERNAHYALVGLVSLLLFIGMVVFVVWLARFQFAKAYDIYDIDFKGPVRGLTNGGEVYFNGIKVGSVTKLSLDSRDPNRVVARIRTASDAPVRIDSTASLEPLGVTGVNYVQITAGTPTKPLLKEATPEGMIPVIRSAPSSLDSLLEGGGTVLARTVEALDRANRLMSDRNIAAFGATLQNVQDITATVRDHKKLLADVDTTILGLNATSQKIGALSDNMNALVNGDGKRTLANLDAAAVQLRATATDARTLLARVGGPAGDFATTGLPQLSRTVAALQSSAENLDRVVGEIEQDPRSLITKAPSRTVEVKP
ncbi:MAG: MCE family protein [Caulobacteraceae bacterium]|nr:MCE family protein [Caulobacter sp.]